MMIPNAPTLDQLRTMPVGDIIALPSEMLAVLQEDADAALKFGDRAREARAAVAKDTGIVRFSDGAITIVADLPKKVDWDQAKLAALVETIRASGEDPSQYVEISFSVSERAYGAWPDAIRRAFEPARTLRMGKPTFRLLRD